MLYGYPKCHLIGEGLEMKQIRIAVTGASGALGGRVVGRLADRAVAQRLIVRDASRAPKLAHAEVATAAFFERPAMVSALTGIETVFFVSAFETEDRLLHQKAAVDAFVEAGVKRVVYTLLADPGWGLRRRPLPTTRNCHRRRVTDRRQPD